MPSWSCRPLGGVATLALLVGCTAVDVPPSASSGKTVEVIALDNTFRPDTIEIVVGSTVRWENRARNDHNVLAVDDSWGASTGDFLPGDVYSFVFLESGTFAYYCSIHGTTEAGMVGQVVVTS